MNKFLKKQIGATLMEVLITMVIVLFGLVGLSQLFLKAQRTTIEAYDRHRALALANQMAEMTRTMMRSSDTQSVYGVAVNQCPGIGSIPSSGNLSNEQIMACFDELSRSSGGVSLGRFTGEGVSSIRQPEMLKAALANCTNATGCNNREMVLYLLNNWTESLAGYSQAAASAPSASVYSNKGFSARGCIDSVCNVSGRKTGCGTNPLTNIFRVRVYWQSDEEVTPDDSYHYCDDPDVNAYWRYTFVDIAIPTPSSLPSRN